MEFCIHHSLLHVYSTWSQTLWLHTCSKGAMALDLTSPIAGCKISITAAVWQTMICVPTSLNPDVIASVTTSHQCIISNTTNSKSSPLYWHTSYNIVILVLRRRSSLKSNSLLDCRKWFISIFRHNFKPK